MAQWRSWPHSASLEEGPGVKIELTVDQCIGSGSCEMLAPTVFEVGDDGFAVILDASPGTELEADVRAAESSCPTSAITVS